MMKTGTSQKCITPETGVELCGYAARLQPSVGKYDDLFARILYMANEGEKIIWIHCDLIGFSNETAWEIRELAAGKASIDVKSVFLSATHTHSGPATVFLRKCGEVAPDYIEFLKKAIAEGVAEAIGNVEETSFCFSRTTLAGISVDRRMPGKNSHLDTALPVLGFKRKDGSFKAIVTNYAMHNVGLSHLNRHISSDIAGYAARLAGAEIPGNPLVLITNGGCGNINPARKSEDYSAVQELGTILGNGIIAETANLKPCGGTDISSSFHEVELPVENMSVADLDRIMEEHRKHYGIDGNSYGAARCREAYRLWYDETRKIIETQKTYPSVSAYIHILKLGSVIFAGINAEVFSPMAEQLRLATGRQLLYVAGYVDGCIGYLVPAAIYPDGGYEVDDAYKFYGHFRLKKGGFEAILNKTAEVVSQ